MTFKLSLKITLVIILLGVIMDAVSFENQPRNYGDGKIKTSLKTF